MALEFAEVFSRQFLLSEGPEVVVGEWSVYRGLPGWTLQHCPAIDRAEILDRSGAVVGCLLGVAVDGVGAVVSKSALRLPAGLQDGDFWRVAETALSALAGKFIAFLVNARGKRVYFDPVIDMPAVFNAKERIVATSPLLAIRREITLNPRLDYRLILQNGENYGMQQTCDPDVIRPLGNHYLDLDDFSLHRHWPHAGDAFDADPGPLEEVAGLIAARLGQILGGLVRAYDCILPITGGNDSRTLAYAMKDDIHLVKQCYAHRATWITGLDCYIGQQIARDLGQEFLIIDAMSEVAEGRIRPFFLRRMKREFQLRTGYQKAPKPAELVAASLAPEADIVLRGNILDVARANQWPRGRYVFDAAHGISKLRIGGRAPEENLSYWRNDYEAWLATVPESARPRALDLAFSELLLPNTLGARLQGYGRSNYVNPFNDRGLLTLCMKVDPKTRKQGRLYGALHSAVGAPDLITTGMLRQDEATLAEVDALFEGLASERN